MTFQVQHRPRGIPLNQFPNQTSDVPLNITSLEGHLQKVEDYLKAYLELYFKTQWGEDPIYEGLRSLEDSIRYSLLIGGKRFRPALSILVAKAIGKPEERVLPFAAAIEFIHTYSLIHDDLPSMDNDDERRGKPSNHKVYGEATALLAGDALQTQAFQHLADSYKSEPEMAIELILLLAKAIGPHGMVGGQALDLRAGEGFDNGEDGKAMRGERLEAMSQWHSMKTGALIRLSVEGAAVLCASSLEVREKLAQFGDKLGLAFQLSDDILDFKGEGLSEASSFPSLMGLKKTQALLQQVTVEAKVLVQVLGEEESQDLCALIDWNYQRKDFHLGSCHSEGECEKPSEDLKSGLGGVGSLGESHFMSGNQ